jgi:uncharacterized membrane protein
MQNKNNKNKLLIKAAITGTLVLGMPQASFAIKTQAEVEKASAQFIKNGKERCAGRVLAGMNDCPTSEHACAGLADEDGNSEEYVWLPVGTCAKIAGTYLRDVKSKKGKMKVGSGTKKTSTKKPG